MKTICSGVVVACLADRRSRCWGLFLAFARRRSSGHRNASRAALRAVLEQEGRTRVLDRYVSPRRHRLRTPTAFEVGNAVGPWRHSVELEPCAPRRWTRGAAPNPGAHRRRRGQRQRHGAARQRQRQQCALAQAELQRVRALRLQATSAPRPKTAPPARRSAARRTALAQLPSPPAPRTRTARTTLKYAGTPAALSCDCACPGAPRVLKFRTERRHGGQRPAAGRDR